MTHISSDPSFLSLSLDHCPIGIMVVSNRNNSLEFINERCREIFHLDATSVQTNVSDTLSGLNGLDVNGHAVPLEDFPIMKSLREKGRSTLTFSILHNDIKKIISMRSSSIVTDGVLRGAVSTVEDISDEFKMRNNLESATLRLENLWRITKKSSISIKEICDVTLEAIAEITQSKYGFFGFLDDAEENMIIHSWTGETMKGCTVVDKPVVFPVGKAGLWAEAIRHRRPLVVNDFSACELPRKGFPDGHVKLESLMVVPHFIGEKIHSVAAVGNKDFGYSQDDVVRISDFLKDIQAVIKQVEAESLLRQSEEKYRNLVELMNEGVLVLSRENDVMFVNRKICELLERDIREIVDGKFVDFVHEDSKDTFIHHQILRKDGASEPYEMTLTNKSGDTVSVLSSPTPLLNEDGEIVGSYEVVTNISNIKRMERQLLQSQKMETIGVLAAGIAHEINTPLQYIIGNADFIKESTDKLIGLGEFIKNVFAEGISPDSIGAVTEMLEELDLDFMAEEIPAAMEESIGGLGHISSIVQSVKGFAHPGHDEAQVINVNERIRDTINISRNEWKHAAEVVTSLDEELPQLFYPPGDFDQIMLNLIVNAAHASQEVFGDTNTKGLITISTRRDNSSLRISITDNGVGVSDAIKDKIFDPFFTTKEVGKGTGIGLAIVLQLVEKHEGKIWLESRKGETTFHIKTPIS